MAVVAEQSIKPITGRPHESGVNPSPSILLLAECSLEGPEDLHIYGTFDQMLGQKGMAPVQIVRGKMYPAECAVLFRIRPRGYVVVAQSSCFAAIFVQHIGHRDLVPEHRWAGGFLKVDDIGIVHLCSFHDVWGQGLDKEIIPGSQ